jgi:hypothetical protein
MDQLQTFRFGLRGENEAEDFLVATSDPRVIQEAYRQMSLPIAKRWHINGPISRVRPGNNLGELEAHGLSVGVRAAQHGTM